ncbi:MAG: c-type cytochrome [Gemmatimonadales bacterium]|nr:c-type cytochrome [Gemmatimonadales bacterium]
MRPTRRPTPLRLVGPVILALVAGCSDSSEPGGGSTVDIQLRGALAAANITALPPAPPQNPALIELGRDLTFDKILSGNRDLACASCHVPASGTTDAQALSDGNGQRGLNSRNAPDLFNRGAAGFDFMFWDGRVARSADGSLRTPAGAVLPSGLTGALAAQAMFPVVMRHEMRGEAGDIDRNGQPNELAAFDDNDFPGMWRALMARVLAVREYVGLFQVAYPATPVDSLGFQHAANAIAAFTVSAYSHANSPFDRYVAGDDAALSEQAKRGALTFVGRAGCASCHNGPALSNNTFTNIGVPQLGPGFGDAAPDDRGREATTHDQADRYKFKVPPLRNVELTAPYMHDGAFTTLEAAVRHYLDVPFSLRNYDASQLEPALQGTVRTDEVEAILSTLDSRVRQPLDLTDAEVADLVVFLQALTDPDARDLSSIAPASVPSGLPVGDQVAR